jgi:hypothetical protein
VPDVEEHIIEHISVACEPQRGWVTVTGLLAGPLEYPVVELTILSAEGRRLASTMIVDSTPEFHMTLHPRDVEPGMPLILRVEVLVKETRVAVREYDFVYAAE